MASDSTEQPWQKDAPGRRTDTPPRSIFNDYHSAYQSIISPSRNCTGTLKGVEEGNTPQVSSRLPPQNNPFIDPAESDDPPHSPPGSQPGSGATTGEQKSQRPRNPMSKRRTNFSRPISISPPPDRVTRPAKAILRDSISSLDLHKLRRSLEEDQHTGQPETYGVRSRIDNSSTVGSPVKTHGDEAGLHCKSVDGDGNIEVRGSLEMMGSSPGMPQISTFRPSSSPAGQAPTIPLPPDPSHVAARGLTGDIFSEPSMYEDTEKLLNLTQPSGTSTIEHETEFVQPQQLAASPGGGLNSEFSWMGNKGKTSFRDLSLKELKQLRKSVHGPSEILAGEDVNVQDLDESYSDEHILTDAVLHSPTPAQRSSTLDVVARADARRAQMLSERLASPPSERGPKGSREASGIKNPNPGAATHTMPHPQTDSVLDFGGLQSSSSRGVSAEVSLRDGPFRTGLFMDESSLASLVGRESADTRRLSALAKGKKVIRSVEVDTEGGPFVEVDEDEGGEWETVGESGMRSRLGTQTSIGRDTSGSSLANVSSNDSTLDERSVAVPWDPFRAQQRAFTTPPSKAVIRSRKGKISGGQAPATVPRYSSANAEEGRDQKLRRTFSSTPALALHATPKYQRKQSTSPTYRHPTPLSSEHQNPFSASPPPVDLQIPGASFELSELKNSGKNKRQAVHTEIPPSPHQQIHISTPNDTRTRRRQRSNIVDMRSDKPANMFFSTDNPSNLALEGTSILNPHSPHTPKSTKSYSRGSLKKTKEYFTASPKGSFMCLDLKFF